MTRAEATTLLVVFVCIAAAPLASHGLGRWLRVPIVVVEIGLGILVGPDVLGWAHDNTVLSVLAQFGLSMLMFLAGSEIQYRTIQGVPLKLAYRTWLIGLPIAAVAALLIEGTTTSAIYVGLALVTTALGTILPIVRDLGWLNGPLGGPILAVGAIGEFGPIVLIALILSGRRPGVTTLFLIAFALLACAAGYLASRPRHPTLARVLSATLHTSGQFIIRLALLTVVALTWLASRFGLDILLGAFSAGVVMRLFLDASGDEHEAKTVESKLDAIGFGLLIPIYFVTSGIRFDLTTLLHRPALFALIPLFLALFLVIRGVPTWLLARRDLPDARSARALALLASSALPLIVVITGLGVDADSLDPGVAAAMVAAGMLSVLIYPLVAVRVDGSAPVETQV